MLAFKVYEEGNRPKYDSGLIERNIDEWKKKPVIMFGKESNFQKGLVALCGRNPYSSVMTIEHNDGMHTFSYMMKKQVKVLPCVEKEQGSFGVKGDSGAMIFFENSDEKLVSVGMLCAISTSGAGYITPIKPFLDAFNLERVVKFEVFNRNGQEEMDTS